MRNPDGRHVGTNKIESILSGCVLVEDWRSNGRHAGQSYNVYNARTGMWHQSWVDNRGLLLLLDGGIEEDRMILTGRSLDAAGETALNRITWTPISPDSVSQLWEISMDDGATWRSAFDGIYVRKR